MKNFHAAIIAGVLIGAASATSYSMTGPKLSARSLNFGNVIFEGKGVINPPRKFKTLTIYNPARGKTISGLKFVIGGSDNANFQLGNNSCSADLAGGARCELTMTFIPTLLKRCTGTLFLSDGADDPMGMVALSGDGVRPHSLIVPSRVNFGKVAIGKTATKTISLKNPNAVAISIHSIATSSSEFGETSTCLSSGSMLGAGKSCEITVTFSPTATCNPVAGAVDGSLTIASDAGTAASKLIGVATRNTQAALFVANQTANLVTVYSLNSQGDAVPISTIGDPYELGAPIGLALDAGGKLYVAGSGIANNSNVTVYGACANGSVAPVAIFKGSATGLNGAGGVALDSSGKIYVTNGFGGPSSSGSINVYAPLGPSMGLLNQAPLAVIGGENTDLNVRIVIALDAAGTIYAANEFGNSITVYPPLGNSTGTLDEAPLATISGQTTELVAPTSIALDQNARIYVTNGFGPSITVYPPLGNMTGTLSEAPITIISGSNTGLNLPEGVAVDRAGNILVSDTSPGQLGGIVSYYPPIGNSTGFLDESPDTSLTGSSTGLQDPRGLLLDSSGTSILVASFLGGPTGTGSVTAYPLVAANSGVVNQPPTRTIGASNTKLDFPRGIAVDNAGNVFVENQFGDPLEGGGEGQGSITTYSPGASGNVSPASNISGPDTGLNLPSALARDLSGNLYIANVYGGSDSTGSVNVYSADSANDASPIAIISGPDTQLDHPLGVAVDASGRIYVSSQTPGITIYQAGSQGDAAPIATISGPGSQFMNPAGIALDSAGNLYVTNTGGGGFALPGYLTVYPPLGQGTGTIDLPPLATIGGDKTSLAVPIAVAVDPSGTIYVANLFGGNSFPNFAGPGSITVYSPLGNNTGTLNEAPTATIVGPDTLLQSPVGIAIGLLSP